MFPIGLILIVNSRIKILNKYNGEKIFTERDQLKTITAK